VGNYGKGVTAVFDRLVAAGCTRAELKLFPGTRHEPQHELNRDEVLREIVTFLDKSLQEY
jgi:alpha-beta hydrolase superfamily lysophospholipase